MSRLTANPWHASVSGLGRTAAQRSQSKRPRCKKGRLSGDDPVSCDLVNLFVRVFISISISPTISLLTRNRANGPVQLRHIHQPTAHSTNVVRYFFLNERNLPTTSTVLDRFRLSGACGQITIGRLSLRLGDKLMDPLGMRGCCCLSVANIGGAALSPTAGRASSQTTLAAATSLLQSNANPD